ncbi:MAG: MiaB/RimO family radical SAM methylthiotransferase [Coriobacteriales bacterium]|nr:MiaB/RimO family radical SAM methylthiotransferase [Coriobacteriales bacterium]
MNKTFYIQTLGCKSNLATSDYISEKLIDAGFVYTNKTNANFLILNTCTVTNEADVKSKKALRQLLKCKADQIYVFGCAVNINVAQFLKISDSPKYFNNPEMLLKEVLKDAGSLKLGSIINENNQASTSPLVSSWQTTNKIKDSDIFRKRRYVKIQDGCNNNCAYCIVNKARGKSYSFDSNHIISYIQKLVNSGCEEVVLTGIDIGAYNFEGINITMLIKEILKKTQIKRIRVSSIEVNNISDDFIKLMASAGSRFAHHLHIPLQSGSKDLLKSMQRKSALDFYLNTVSKLKLKIPDIALSTDIIVGFPGETDNDFAQTIDVCQKCGFMKIHVFKYSKRYNTPAALMSNQVDEKIKNERSAKLIAISDELQKQDLKKRIGTQELVLIESSFPKDENDIWAKRNLMCANSYLSRSDSYHICCIDSMTSLKFGKLYECEFIDCKYDNKFGFYALAKLA